MGVFQSLAHEDDLARTVALLGLQGAHSLCIWTARLAADTISGRSQWGTES